MRYDPTDVWDNLRAYLNKIAGTRTSSCPAGAHWSDEPTPEWWQHQLAALEAGRCPCCGDRLERHPDPAFADDDEAEDWAGCRRCCWDYKLRKLAPEERIDLDDDVAVTSTGWPQPCDGPDLQQ